MKNVKFLLSAALVFLASAALAQDFSAPQYAKWGATPEEREQNILNSNFLKESCDNRDYDAAAHYLKGLIDKIPDAAESIYQRGAVVYKNKINRAKSVAEKNMFIDSLMLMYDMRACFDNSWSMNEAGVTHLADMTEQTIGGAYDEITSDATNTFGDGGSLSTETDNAWANVEPGAKDINTNLTWMMDQSYNAIKAGCEAAVTSIKNDLATTGDAFEAVGKKAADTSAAISEASQKAQQSTQQNTGPSKGVTAAAGAGIGAAVGSFLGPLGAIGGAAIGGFFGSLFGHANGLKSAKFPHMANVDEQGPEMLVRQPQSGRYTYLETGDGVVPADITSRLFEMGGNPDA